MPGTVITQHDFWTRIPRAHEAVAVLMVAAGMACMVSSPCVSHLTGRKEIHSNLVGIYIMLVLLSVILGYGRIM